MWPMCQYVVTMIMQDMVDPFLRCDLDVAVMKLTSSKDVA